MRLVQEQQKTFFQSFMGSDVTRLWVGTDQDLPRTLNWGYMVPNSGYLGPNRG